MWREGAYLTLVSVQKVYCFRSIYNGNAAGDGLISAIAVLMSK